MHTIMDIIGSLSMYRDILANIIIVSTRLRGIHGMKFIEYESNLYSGNRAGPTNR